VRLKQLRNAKDFDEAKNVYWNHQGTFWENLDQTDVKFFKSLQELVIPATINELLEQLPEAEKKKTHI